MHVLQMLTTFYREQINLFENSDLGAIPDGRGSAETLRANPLQDLFFFSPLFSTLYVNLT